ncbi:MAG: ATP-binding protein, partial [Rikenellaceae bacterium]
SGDSFSYDLDWVLDSASGSVFCYEGSWFLVSRCFGADSSAIFALSLLLSDSADRGLGLFPSGEFTLSDDSPSCGSVWVSGDDFGFWVRPLQQDQPLIILCGWLGFFLLYYLLFGLFRGLVRAENVLFVTFVYGVVLLCCRLMLFYLPFPFTLWLGVDDTWFSPVNQLISSLVFFTFSYFCYRAISLYRWRLKRLSSPWRVVLLFLGDLYCVALLMMIHLGLVECRESLNVDLLHPLRFGVQGISFYLGATLLLCSLIIRSGARRWHERRQDLIGRTLFRLLILLIVWSILGGDSSLSIWILIVYMVVSRFALWFWFSRFGVNGYLLVIVFFSLYWVAMVGGEFEWSYSLQWLSMFCYLVVYFLVSCRFCFWLLGVRSLASWVRFSFVSRSHLMVVYLVGIVVLFCMGVVLLVWFRGMIGEQRAHEGKIIERLVDCAYEHGEDYRQRVCDESFRWLGIDLAFYDTDGSRIYSYDSHSCSSIVDRGAFGSFACDSSMLVRRSASDSMEIYVRCRDSRGRDCGYIGFRSVVGTLSDHSFATLESLVNLFMIVLVVSCVSSLLLYRLLTRQVKTLRDAMTSAGVMQPISLSGGARMDYEFRDLIRKYNLMVEALQQSYRVVARYERESLWQERAQRMAHEIKNPLTPMKLKVQMLQLVDAQDGDLYRIKCSQTLRLILRQIDIIDAAVDDFRDFAHAHKSDPTMLNLVSIVMGVALVYDNYRGARVRVVNRLSMPLWIYGDSNQISRLFANLWKNGVEATEGRAGGLVEILLDRTPDGDPMVVVEDNGKGIVMSERSKLFEPNFTTKGDGSGLGLPISKEIVERWGGEITYANRPSGGTIFVVRFPSCLR